jgi:hypothetical protein
MKLTLVKDIRLSDTEAVTIHSYKVKSKENGCFDTKYKVKHLRKELNTFWNSYELSTIKTDTLDSLENITSIIIKGE